MTKSDIPSRPEKSLILIADDSPTSVRLLQRQLEKKYQTIVAVNGRETLKLAERSLPDLILLDILMPGLDGFETCEELKSSTATKDIPVIFLTGLDKTKDIVKGFRLGACDYVTKPFRAEELTARVETHLELKKARDTQKELISQLQDALHNIKTLKGLVPICMHCKQIRDDSGYWEHLETYIEEHSEAEFSHGLCPNCAETHYSHRMAPTNEKK